MPRYSRLMLLSFTLVALAAPVAPAGDFTPQLAAIDEAVTAGTLDAEQALLYKFYYVFDQDKLPAAYRPAAMLAPRSAPRR